MYHHKSIEKKWQAKWQEGFVSYKADLKSKKQKKYILVEFPFPSGAGLHVGHTKSYMALDILARKYRMQGNEVLYPIGFDDFGLPTENYAIQNNIHPKKATDDNIKRFKEQIAGLGISFDWDKEVRTDDPNYYRWTQWIFLQMFKKGLAYQDTTKVWWCSELKTVLANEEVIDGKSERGEHKCERLSLTQWMLAITKYADRLDKDLDKVDYLDVIKTQQKNWIGKSTGAKIKFKIQNLENYLEVYTTRADTIFGVSFMVISPEHNLVEKLVTKEHKQEVEKYLDLAKQKTDLERQQQKEKTGVFTGSYVIHPFTNQEIPIWIADYVLVSYGTGAIMAVPAHDERDKEFATKYNLGITEVNDGEKLINSQEFDGISIKDAQSQIVEKLSGQKLAKFETQFKLRDWVFSRQRYWGEPFPIVWISEDDYKLINNQELLPPQIITRQKNGKTEYAVTLAESELPVVLPEVESYLPQGLGEGPLALAKDWVNVWYNFETGKTLSITENPESGNWVKVTRETDTMPNWAGSSWYFLRYLDSKNNSVLAEKEILDKWLPVDIYNGGMEHVTLHLLYSRFWHKFLYDIGVVSTEEPYQRRIAHGMILAEGGVKMSKSKGNTVDPLEMCEAFGADALRSYVMFMGPYNEAIAWDTNGLIGCNRFLTKCFHWVEAIANNKSLKLSTTKEELERDLHNLIKKISEDIDSQKYNTCISSMMEFLNIYQNQDIGIDNIKTFVTILSPFAPHLSEELWEMLGEQKSVHKHSWPKYDESKLESDTEDYQIHINGKMRAIITVPKNISDESLRNIYLNDKNVLKYIEGKNIKKYIVLSDKKIVIIII